jgi:hypothetical protein
MVVAKQNCGKNAAAMKYGHASAASVATLHKNGNKPVPVREQREKNCGWRKRGAG